MNKKEQRVLINQVVRSTFDNITHLKIVNQKPVELDLKEYAKQLKRNYPDLTTETIHKGFNRVFYTLANYKTNGKIVYLLTSDSYQQWAMDHNDNSANFPKVIINPRNNSFESLIKRLSRKLSADGNIHVIYYDNEDVIEVYHQSLYVGSINYIVDKAEYKLNLDNTFADANGYGKQDKVCLQIIQVLINQYLALIS